MKIEDRLRSGLPEAVGEPRPSADLWSRVEDGMARRARRAAVGRAALIVIVLVAFAGVMGWLGVSLLGGSGKPAISPTPPPPSSTPSPSSATPPPPLPGFVPSTIAFFDEQHAIAVGPPEASCQPTCSVVAVSEDAGATWHLAYEATTPVTGITTLGQREAWATSGTCVTFPPENCSDRILHSVDGGATWEETGQAAVYDLTFGSSVDGWALSGNARDLAPGLPTSHTMDGGRTWQDVTGPCPDPTPYPTGISFADADHGWVACVGDAATIQQGKAVMATEDGGQTWNPVAEVFAPGDGATVGDGGLPLSGHAPGITFLPNGHGWLWMDRDCLYGTVDGGHSWTRLGICKPDVAFIVNGWLVDDQTGYALVRDGDAGRLQLEKTTDGGQTFTNVTDWPLPG